MKIIKFFMTKLIHIVNMIGWSILAVLILAISPIILIIACLSVKDMEESGIGDYD